MDQIPNNCIPNTGMVFVQTFYLKQLISFLETPEFSSVADYEQVSIEKQCSDVPSC